MHNVSPPSLGLIEYDTIYTDGSWKKSETIREFLNGGGIVRCGGAVVLGRKGTEFTTIFIEVDVDVESAFEVEMISLLVAIAICEGKPMTIYSD